MTDYQQTYIELKQLADLAEQWGANIEGHIPKIAFVPVVGSMMWRGAGRKISVLFNKCAPRLFDAPAKAYDVFDHSAYERLKANGPEELGYENAVQVLTRTLKSGDENMRPVLAFMSAAKGKKYLPEIQDRAGLQALSKKYKINSLYGLLQK